jgi:hypothetical protein
MRRGTSLVTAVLMVTCGLTACTEEEKPIEVPGEVRQSVETLLKAADPTVRPTFTGETCNTDPLADPPDDHRWRMTARTDATGDDLRAAATRLGWQPERAEDGTLLLVNAHQFDKSLQLVVLGGTVTMLAEKDCTGTELTERDYAGGGQADMTDRQGDRLEGTVDDVRDTLAAVDRALKVRPKEGVYADDPGPGTYSGCDAGDRSGAMWQLWDAVVAEVTSDSDLAPAADRLVEAADGWRVTERVAETDDRGNRDFTLALESADGGATLDIRLSFWGGPTAPDGVRIHVSRAKTTCVAVDKD